MAQLAIFDTYELVKRLETQGASTGLAKSIVDTIQQGRMIELSALVSKTDFYTFKDEFLGFKEEVYAFRDDTKERFARLESEIAVIKKEIAILDNKIEDTKQELKKDIETTKQELRQEIELKTSQLETKIEKSKNTIVMWMIGLISAVGLMLLRLMFMNG